MKKTDKDLPVTGTEKELPTLPKANFKLQDIEEELSKNKKLIEMTSGGEHGEGDSGSDDEPSEDNMGEDELAEVVPIQKKKEEEIKPPLKKKTEPIKVEKGDDLKAASAQ